MKKVLLILVPILLIGSIIGFTILKNQSSPTAINAIEKSGSKVSDIVNEKDVKDGKVIVFTQESISSKGFTLQHAYVKKTLFGWKCIDTDKGGHGGSSQLSSGYYNLHNNIHLITGYVADNNISKVDIKVNDNIINPEMITINNVRLWVLYLDNSSNLKSINVLGKTVKGDVVRDINLSEAISLAYDRLLNS